MQEIVQNKLKKEIKQNSSVIKIKLRKIPSEKTKLKLFKE